MTARVAFLRAVNVGGRNRVPMGDLRAALTERGVEEVSTVLQSGNVVFERGGSDAHAATVIRTTIADVFGLDIDVLVRSGAELTAVLAANPFLADGEQRDPATLHVAFLEKAPARKTVSSIDEDRSPPDTVVVRGREAYLSYPGGSGRSRLTLGYLEQKLGVRGTARNWRTVEKLAALLDAGTMTDRNHP